MVTEEHFADLLAHYTFNDAQSWLQEMASATQGKLGSVDISTSGSYYVSEIEQSHALPSYEQTRENRRTTTHHGDNIDITYGGFFAPFEAEERNDFIRALFDGHDDKGQWLVDALEYRPGLFSRARSSEDIRADATEHLTREQKAFVDGLDEFQASFLRGARKAPPNLTSFLSITNDDTLTDWELYEYFAQHGFKERIADMGIYGDMFIKYVGGNLQGKMDYESQNVTPSGIIINDRYSPELEFSDYPAHTVRRVAEELFPRNPELEGLFEQAISDMEGLCSTNPARTFFPSTEQRTR